MKRRDFLKNSAALGLGTSFLATLFGGCSVEEIFTKDFSVNFSGKVLIIGGGSAGMTAGYLLDKHDIDFQIIEASSIYGGRMKKLEGFADFPIDLGAEWIHNDPSILSKLLNDPTSSVDIDLVHYQPQTYQLWKNGKLVNRNFFSNFYYGEYKFKHSTWFDFFEQNIVPNIADKFVFNSPITDIDYSGEKVVVTNTDGTTFEGDKVLVTVPIKILKNEQINFIPEFPAAKTNALKNVDMPPILKIFMEFSERFYPDLLQVGSIWNLIGGGENVEDENMYFDAAFGKETNKNVLCLFSLGDPAAAYSAMNSEEEVINAVLAELDEIFDGKASATLQQYHIQNWTHEPYIQGSYSHYSSDYTTSIQTLLEPLNNKVYFAGEALTLEGDTSTVHGAGQSAYEAIEIILKN